MTMKKYQVSGLALTEMVKPYANKKECELCGERYSGSTFDECPYCKDAPEVECSMFEESIKH